MPLLAKLWLSIEEASAYSGLGKGFLLGLIDRAKVTGLKAGPQGSWVILRASLESYQGEA